MTQLAHRLGARVVAVHHASPALNAAAIPGPDRLYLPALRRVYRRAYGPVDAVMSVVDPEPDSGREAAIPLRFGIHRAFRPRPAEREGHRLYVGRLSREKRIEDLLAAARRLDREVLIVGDGPDRRMLARAGGPVRIGGFVSDRDELVGL